MANKGNKRKSELGQIIPKKKRVSATEDGAETQSSQEKILTNLSNIAARMDRIEGDIAKIKESTQKVPEINAQLDKMQTEIAEIRENIAGTKTPKETIIGSVNPITLIRLGLPATNLDELNTLETGLAIEEKFQSIVSFILHKNYLIHETKMLRIYQNHR